MQLQMPHVIWRIVAGGIVALALGCAGQPASHEAHNTPPGTQPDLSGLEASHLMPEASAWIDPPIGWHLDKHDVDAKHTHVTWLSPTGDTAYGVVLMNLPLPVGPDMVLWGFLNHLRAADSKAELLEKQPAPDLQGIRFIADSGLYRIRVNLTVRDWHAWAVYAGTMRDKPERPDEVLQAELARDHTRVGK